MSLITIAALFSFVGERDRTVLNKTLYDGFVFVGEPGYNHFYTREGVGLTSYGEDGLIVNKAIDPAAYQVLFLGDSYVKSAQVSDRFKFTELVENKWHDSYPDTAVQTINLGLGGLDMRSYLSFSKNIDAIYQPEKVILLLSQNDFKVLARNESVLQNLDHAADQPLIVPAADSFAKRLINKLGLRGFFRQIKLQIEGFTRSETRSEEESLSDEAISRQAISLQLEALTEIWGDRLVILYFVPIPDLGLNSQESYSDAVLQEMDALGIPYINLYRPFRQAFLDYAPPMGFNNSIIGQGHWNKAGHQIVAAEVIRYLESEALGAD